jgi:hypothetical protein
LIALAVMVLGLITSAVFLQVREPWPERYAADLRERGEPATWAEAAAPVLSDDRNAAADVLTDMRSFGWTNPPLSMDLALNSRDPRTYAAARSRLTVHEYRCRQLLDTLSGRSIRCDTTWLSTQSRAIAKGMDGCRAESAFTLRLSRLIPPGDTDGALSRQQSTLLTLEALCALGTACEPLDQWQSSVVIRHDEHAIRAVRAALIGEDLPLRDAHERLGPLLRPKRVWQWRRLMRVERASTLDRLRPPPAGQATSTRSSSPLDAAFLTLYRWSQSRQTQARLDVLDRVIDLGDPLPDPLTVCAGISELVPTQRSLGSLEAHVMPAWQCLGLLEDALHADIQREFARIALAASVHRAETGAWPGSIDELLPLLGDGAPPGFEGVRFRLDVEPGGGLSMHVTAPEELQPILPWWLPSGR